MAGWSFLRHRESPYNTDLVRTWTHTRGIAYSPTAATVAKFVVTGGDIMVHLMYGTILTTLEAVASNVSVTTNPTTGTTGTVATTAEGNGLLAGNMILVEGDGTAAIVSATVKWSVLGTWVPWIVNIGDIEVIHAAAQTGSLRWDLFWEPLASNSAVAAA